MALAGQGYGCIGSCVGACVGGTIGAFVGGVEGAVKVGVALWLVGYFGVNGVLEVYDQVIAARKSGKAAGEEGPDENGAVDPPEEKTGEEEGASQPPSPPPMDIRIDIDIVDDPGDQ
jgi:hypothetical protein